MFPAITEAPVQTWMALLGFLLAPLAGVYVVERRGRHDPLDPHRVVELGTLLDSVPDSVVIVDTDGNIVDANSSAAAFLQARREDLRGKNLAEVGRPLFANDTDKVVDFRPRLVSRALAGESVREEQRHAHNRKTGQLMELLLSANPIRNENGQIVGALLLARDVTELSELQRRIADVERHHAIGHFAAGIAHDFNNALETIGQAATLLQLNEDRSPEERATLLSLIQNAVRRGSEIVGRIREYLLSGSGTLTNVVVGEILQQAIDLTQPMWQPKGNIKFSRELKCDAVVRANTADLRRVFTNLIVNSVQAMPRGGQIVVGCEEDDTNVHLWVRDTGSGIPQGIQERIFHPYFTTKPSGTGLGLSGAQKIVLGLGGKISFQSREGAGTQFDIYLPRADAQLNPSEKPRDDSQARGRVLA